MVVWYSDGMVREEEEEKEAGEEEEKKEGEEGSLFDAISLYLSLQLFLCCVFLL